MKTNPFVPMRLLLVVLFVFLVLGGCSSGGGEVDPVYIPVLTTQWINANDVNNKFVFTKTGGTNEGTFTGTERNDNSGSATTYSITGSYTNRHIEFTYDPDQGDKKGTYIGTYTGDNNNARIVMMSTTRKFLILRR